MYFFWQVTNVIGAQDLQKTKHPQSRTKLIGGDGDILRMQAKQERHSSNAEISQLLAQCVWLQLLMALFPSQLNRNGD